MIVISHSDCDGLISVSTFFKYLNTSKLLVYFTSATKLKDTLIRIISTKNNLDELKIFDLSANNITLTLSSVFQHSLWIDHHEWEKLSIPGNVEVFLDKDAPSASSLVSKYFKVDFDLVEIANQIDKNQIKSEEAEFLRDLIAAIKRKYGYNFKIINSKLRAIARDLAFKGLEKFLVNEESVKMVEEYREWLKIFEENVIKKVQIFEINNLKIAIYEDKEFVPAYLISNKLQQYYKHPFDVIAILIHKISKLKITTKVELRSQTNKNVFEIAKALGGGGHKVASGASLPRFLNSKEVLNLISQYINVL